MTITLSTIKSAAPKEVADQITLHLLLQKDAAINSLGHCLLRYDGLKCAMGCLIADEEYDESMEGYVWPDIVRMWYDREKLVCSKEVCDVIESFRWTHDNIEPRYWHKYIHKIYDEHNIDKPDWLGEYDDD